MFSLKIIDQKVTVAFIFPLGAHKELAEPKRETSLASFSMLHSVTAVNYIDLSM